MKCVIINAVSINLIDVTAIDTFEHLIKELKQKGITMKLARANSQFEEMTSKTTSFENLPDIKNYNSVYDAVQEYLEENK